MHIRVCACVSVMNYLSERASYHEYIVDELTDNIKVVFYSQQAIPRR